MTTRTLNHRCHRTHRTTRAYLRCAFGTDLTDFRGSGPYVVLHLFRIRHERSDRVHAEAFADGDEAAEHLAGIASLHSAQGKCSGTCTGNAYLVTTRSTV